MGAIEVISKRITELKILVETASNNYHYRQLKMLLELNQHIRLCLTDEKYYAANRFYLRQNSSSK